MHGTLSLPSSSFRRGGSVMETEVEGQRVRLGWGRDLQRCVPSLTLFFLFFLICRKEQSGVFSLRDGFGATMVLGEDQGS